MLWALEGGLEREGGAAAVAREDVGRVGEAEGAQQGQAMENVAYVLGVCGLARGIRMVVLNGVVGKGGMSGELGDAVIDRSNGDDWGRLLGGGECVRDGRFDRG